MKFILIALLVGTILAIFFAITKVWVNSQAKVRAKRMLEDGDVTDVAEFNRISGILSTKKNDLEAADLWKKLQGIKPS